MILPTDAEIAYMREHVADSKVASIIITNTICGVAACTAVSLRIGSRYFAKAKFGVDDWSIMFALSMYIGFIVGFSLSTHWGGGRHRILVTDARSLTWDSIANESLYCATLVGIKYSILFLYRRIFPQYWFKNTLIILGSFTLAWALAALFCSIFQCVPIKASWDPRVSGFCINYGKITLAFGIINIGTHFIMLGLPVPLVWNLKISKTQKWLLTVTFMAGGIACIVSVVRLFFSGVVGSTFDPSWDDINSGIASTVELCIGIIAACIPTYRALFNVIFHRSETVNEHVNLKVLLEQSTKGWTRNRPDFTEHIKMPCKPQTAGTNTWIHLDDCGESLHSRMPDSVS